MKCFLPVLCICAVLLLFATTVSSETKMQSHHKISHLVKRRSASSSKPQIKKKFRIPISSFVDDVSESTEFRDREKKLKSLETKGELYHHGALASKRKYVPNINKDLDDDVDDKDDDDDIDDNEESTTTGSKKHSILKDNNNRRPDKSDNTEDEVDDQADNDADEDSSGSGENEDDNNEENDDSNNDEDENDDENGSQRSGNLKCRKKCSIPITFHKCAFPRCSMKMGTIKDLCFFLCKHQKEKCEDVCE